MIKTFTTMVRTAADNTPASRNRVVDAWRVVALMFVVLGHWLSASIWVRPDGSILAGNTLEWFPAAEHLTWVFQVMPIFFLAGGFANAAALSGSPPDANTWTTLRARRLFTPVVPLVVVWVVLVLLLRNAVPNDVLHAGTLSATLPLWFIGVYLVMVALAPLTFEWWRRTGWISVAILAVAALSVDVLRFGANVDDVGWINYLFVWGFVHQLGFAWFDRDRIGVDIPPVMGAIATVVGLGALIATTGMGWYPVSMVTIPGGGMSNMTPPTFANGFLAIAQAGIIIGTMKFARDFVTRRMVWRFVVGVSVAMMTLYLWHLTSLSLLGAAGIFIADGWLFSFEPGTAVWWWMRIPFIVILAVITIGLAAVFLPFETAIYRGPSSRNVVRWVGGIVLAITSAGGMALAGLVNKDATLNWWIVGVTITAAAALSAWPTFIRRRPVSLDEVRPQTDEERRGLR